MNIPFYEDVAVLLLSELALSGPGSLVPLSRLSKKHGVSLLFLKKIVRLLRTAGFVTSKEGAGGGYMLAVDPAKTNLWDVFTAIDQSRTGQLPKSGSLVEGCPINTACLPEIIRKSVRSHIRNSLESVSLLSLLPGKLCLNK